MYVFIFDYSGYMLGTKINASSHPCGAIMCCAIYMDLINNIIDINIKILRSYYNKILMII